MMLFSCFEVGSMTYIALLNVQVFTNKFVKMSMCVINFIWWHLVVLIAIKGFSLSIYFIVINSMICSPNRKQ